MERTGLLQLAGKDVTVVGPDIEVGQDAPSFTSMDQDWNFVEPLNVYKGKVRVFTALPSVSTGVCDTETRRFNEGATNLSDDIVIIGISMDLPYTLKNYCASAGIDRVQMVSDAFDSNFGEKYGALIKDRRILRRAVFVVDKEGKIVYVDYMPSIGDQPDYEAVLAASTGAL